MKLSYLFVSWAGLGLLSTAGHAQALAAGSGSQSGAPVSSGELSGCLEPGESRTLVFDRPSLDDDGMPVDAEWVVDGNGCPTGVPQAFEHDSTSGNDPMGAAEAQCGNAHHARIEVRNQDGQLVGPNSEDVTEWFEGGCIEVILCWKFRHSVEVEISWRAAPGGIGAGGAASVRVWQTAQVCSPDARDVCEC